MHNFITDAKDFIAEQKGYHVWQEYEAWIIDHNQPVVVAQLLVAAMEEVCKYIQYIHYDNGVQQGKYKLACDLKDLLDIDKPKDLELCYFH